MGIQESLSDQLLLEFHNQFSVNHNHQQSLFVQILGAVIIVFTGYGYVLINTLGQSEYPLDERLLPITAILVVIVLSFLSFILISQGWGFRSAQKIIKTIRLNILDSEEYSMYFKGYGESLDDLPDFYGINLYVLEILKIFTTIVTCIIHACFCRSIICMITIFIFSVIIERIYYCSRRTKTNSNDGVKAHLKCKECNKIFDDDDMICLDCAKKRTH